MEEVIFTAQPKFKLLWKELLSPKEITEWVVHQRKPRRILQGALAEPGVYRFLFTEAGDGSVSHIPFYVGEAGNLGKRIRHYFVPPKHTVERLRNGTVKLNPGWSVRGNIRNSGGHFDLQLLSIEGNIVVDGVSLSQNSFDSPFGRKLLENLAVLHSLKVEKLQQLNRGLPETSKNLFGDFKQPRAQIKQ